MTSSPSPMTIVILLAGLASLSAHPNAESRALCRFRAVVSAAERCTRLAPMRGRPDVFPAVRFIAGPPGNCCRSDKLAKGGASRSWRTSVVVS
jgi:hypothetical protein